MAEIINWIETIDRDRLKQEENFWKKELQELSSEYAETRSRLQQLERKWNEIEDRLAQIDLLIGEGCDEKDNN